ncbi:UDP-2,4-diacetamido-2,4,6-trideoxy-beta-L-altropyranose hydrolase [Oceanirhabdus sp. W0125-5]|uniref:UDP-2,4-diacetamido-2,4, 6-trideoxy-beta-L-altropyranose hydrolase n=1 Tax=Oceanirhabdus sp. W0125-5 TaxID=2999116 RepID=UPI0022F30BF2|nr:UDP-2,4-diacetamido-2,4,6-trideoxy-beta-L-altropyranose hydrolase [Oceanirhabdus sp. W0125-5]WBW95447.1 UDP-2,4-diacetamido-2,4,6-trideoxy-beta-L-altropyranose hydrolase [Oceanirhabdus sp. W0125-5]
MKIAIRADGGSQIGMGHIMRTLVLAKELAKTNEVFYVCKTDNSLSDTYINGIKKIKTEGFKAVYINKDNVLEDLKNIHADLLITDSYDVDENYFIETKKKFKKTAYIDDMNLHYFDVDILINQNTNAVDFDYKVNDYAKLLLGSNYVMLREEFRNTPKKLIEENVKDILITVGGADPFNITENILSSIKDLDYIFHVVVGPSFDERNNLKDYESEKIKLYYNANMYQIMQKCDMAISACGSTLYELASCGVPTLGLIIANNQKGIANKLNDEGVIKNLGWYNEISSDYLLSNIEYLANDKKLRQHISDKGQNFVDGKGVERLCRVINNILN